ncbi:acidic phospholipase A2-like [Physella acuta]|uniref:acidic phospholipase A2-like n=1 Tax=Physella acuta TaxID=109671 RepID=UPI0027DD3967|nr:acidic phospholipase A2-like [Physella acuta]
MSFLVYISLACLAMAYAHPSNGGQSDKRDLLQLGILLGTVTGNAALNYNGYGCFCGEGGFGTPVDEVDRCCQVHDDCYDALSVHGCNPKAVTYHYTCSGHNCHCNTHTSSCADRACTCDIDFANCVAAQPYDGRFYHYNHDNC